MREKKKARWIWLALFALLVIIAVVALLESGWLTDRPFAGSRAFDSISGVFSGESGRVYVIDKGKKSLLVMDAGGKLEMEIKGGSTTAGFYYASLVTEGDNGDIFISDVLYSGEGNTIEAERIFRIDPDGGNMTQLVELRYDGEGKAPLQYGRIQYILASGDSLYYLVSGEGQLVRHQFSLSTGKDETVAFDSGENDLGHATLRTDTLLPVWDDRVGNIYMSQEDGSVRTVSADCGAPWGLAADSSYIYYADMESFSVCRMDYDGNSEPIIQCDTVPYLIQSSGGRVYCCDNLAYYWYADGQTGYTDTVPLANTALRNILWILCCLGALILLALFVRFVIIPLLSIRSTASFQRIIIVLLVSVCVAVLVSYMTLDTLISSQNESVMRELNLFSEIMVQSCEPEALKSVDELSDYGGEEYRKEKSTFDALTDASYEEGQYYYYLVWSFDDSLIYCVMDYESTSTARHPTYPLDMPGYYECLVQGETVEISSEVSSFGTYSYVLKPVFDDNGDIIAGMEVGVNLDAQRQAQRTLIWEVVLTVFCASVVLVMVIIEGIMYLDVVSEYRRSAALNAATPKPLPLRTLMFVAFTADCLQDSFVSILANDLYTPFWGIPQGVGAALPISAELLFAALFSLIGGSFIARSGAKRTTVAGFAMQLAGFLVCWLMQTYMGLLLGKIIIGIGLGLVTVSINSYAAAGGDEKETIASFAGVNAGMLAGAAVGSGLGSVILSISSAYSVFLVGGFLMALGLAISLYTRDLAVSHERTERHGFGKFFINRRVLSFLVLMLLPFSMALAFKTYFFPIYAVQAGLSEANVAQIFLLCGLIVIYAGPALTNVLCEKLGLKWTSVMSSAIMALSMLVFVLSPSLLSACAGMLLLSVASSFGFTSCSSHYSELPAVRKYGESRAMGVYTLFDNAGQTLGPVAYGALLIMGSQPGTLVFGVGMAAVTALFTVLNVGGKEKTKV